MSKQTSYLNWHILDFVYCKHRMLVRKHLNVQDFLPQNQWLKRLIDWLVFNAKFDACHFLYKRTNVSVITCISGLSIFFKCTSTSLFTGGTFS